MRLFCQGSNVSSSDGATELQGKTGEILRMSRDYPWVKRLQPSHTATANLPLCNASGRVNQKIRIKMNVMLTEEQQGSLKTLLLETSQGAKLFSLPSHISSTVNSSFPRDALFKHHDSWPHLHPLFSPSLLVRLCSIHPSNVPAFLALHPS